MPYVVSMVSVHSVSFPELVSFLVGKETESEIAGYQGSRHKVRGRLLERCNCLSEEVCLAVFTDFNHCPIGTATTHIGSSCACMVVKVVLSNWSRPIKSSSVQPSGTNHSTVSRCGHCDGEVVMHSAMVI